MMTMMTMTTFYLLPQGGREGGGEGGRKKVMVALLTIIAFISTMVLLMMNTSTSTNTMMMMTAIPAQTNDKNSISPRMMEQQVVSSKRLEFIVKEEEEEEEYNDIDNEGDEKKKKKKKKQKEDLKDQNVVLSDVDEHRSLAGNIKENDVLKYHNNNNDNEKDTEHNDDNQKSKKKKTLEIGNIETDSDNDKNWNKNKKNYYKNDEMNSNMKKKTTSKAIDVGFNKMKKYNENNKEDEDKEHKEGDKNNDDDEKYYFANKNEMNLNKIKETIFEFYHNNNMLKYHNNNNEENNKGGEEKVNKENEYDYYWKLNEKKKEEGGGGMVKNLRVVSSLSSSFSETNSKKNDNSKISQHRYPPPRSNTSSSSSSSSSLSIIASTFHSIHLFLLSNTWSLSLASWRSSSSPSKINNKNIKSKSFQKRKKDDEEGNDHNHDGIMDKNKNYLPSQRSSHPPYNDDDMVEWNYHRLLQTDSTTTIDDDGSTVVVDKNGTVNDTDSSFQTPYLLIVEGNESLITEEQVNLLVVSFITTYNERCGSSNATTGDNGDNGTLSNTSSACDPLFRTITNIQASTTNISFNGVNNNYYGQYLGEDISMNPVRRKLIGPKKYFPSSSTTTPRYYGYESSSVKDNNNIESKSYLEFRRIMTTIKEEDQNQKIKQPFESMDTQQQQEQQRQLQLQQQLNTTSMDRFPDNSRLILVFLNIFGNCRACQGQRLDFNLFDDITSSSLSVPVRHKGRRQQGQEEQEKNIDDDMTVVSVPDLNTFQSSLNSKIDELRDNGEIVFIEQILEIIPVVEKTCPTTTKVEEFTTIYHVRGVVFSKSLLHNLGVEEGTQRIEGLFRDIYNGITRQLCDSLYRSISRVTLVSIDQEEEELAKVRMEFVIQATCRGKDCSNFGCIFNESDSGEDSQRRLTNLQTNNGMHPSPPRQSLVSKGDSIAAKSKIDIYLVHSMADENRRRPPRFLQEDDKERCLCRKRRSNRQPTQHEFTAAFQEGLDRITKDNKLSSCDECSFPTDCKSRVCSAGRCAEADTGLLLNSCVCRTNAECESGFCQEDSSIVVSDLLVSGTCQGKLPSCRACLNGDECLSGFCTDDRCAEASDGKLKNGCACTTTASCQSGRCVDSFKSIGVLGECTEKISNTCTQPCLLSNDCESGLCGSIACMPQNGVLLADGCSATLSPECESGVLENNSCTSAQQTPAPSIQRWAICGDGILDFPEECDDGNDIDTDECNNACLEVVNTNSLSPTSSPSDSPTPLPTDTPSTVVCGNGILDLPEEECDDGNAIDGDSCTNKCTLAICGDGILALDGSEECDDGNDIDTDECNNSCLSSIPMEWPSESPTDSPTVSPTTGPSDIPTMPPSTSSPSTSPTQLPTPPPTLHPSTSPTHLPTHHPTMHPSTSPTQLPTHHPTMHPTKFPSASPTIQPTSLPSTSPSSLPTSSPSFPPTISPFGKVVLELGNIVTSSDMDDPASISYRAVDWLATNRNSNPGISIEEQYAIVMLYLSNGGENWDRKLNWLSSTVPMCAWEGVDNCIAIDIRVTITDLRLEVNNLVGTIPSTVGLFTSLTFLGFYGNLLMGAIPTQIGQMMNLNRLDLDYNALTGKIPTQLGQLTSLSSLYLQYNDLTGTIPTQIAPLTNLQYLDILSNGLTGTIPTQIGQLTSLLYLDLESNALSGTIPTQIGELVNLWILHFDNNALTGTIPTQIGQVTKNFEHLDFNDNDLTGTIPTEIGQLINLKSLYFTQNNLVGTIPANLADLTSLTFLDFSHNALTGSITTQLWALTSLRYIYFHGNDGLVDGLVDDLNGLFCDFPTEEYAFYQFPDLVLVGIDPTPLTCDCCYICGTGAPDSSC